MPPPRHEAELLVRARALRGRTLGELALALDGGLDGAPDRRTKGRAGQLVERALGASSGSRAEPDFPSLGIELKTIPVGAGGRVRESTFVCTIALDRIAAEAWPVSWVRRKLAQVLWVPIEASPRRWPDRRIGAPLLWRPSPAEEATLRADYDELSAFIGLGGAADLDARRGVVLQVRPKAPHGRARTAASGEEGAPVDVVRRGFYLRATFTQRLLAAAGAALPGRES